jgi:1-acyl-sn-glycerol-3-phosphate acyltransferase
MTRGPVARRSPALAAFFGPWFERFAARHLNAIRVAAWGMPDVATDAPVVVWTNHPSWWDAALYVVLNRRLFAGRAGFGPMDAAMVRRYRFFERIGAFPVEMGTARGAAAFLEAAHDVLSARRRVLWVAAQGRFADVRDRPLGLRPGIARLPEIAPHAIFLPMAIECAFWTERGAEALVAFGPPMTGTRLSTLERRARLARMEAALADTMDRLADDVRSRDPARFRTVLAGRSGIGGVSDLWRGTAARWRGVPFDPAHGAGPLHPHFPGPPPPGGRDSQRGRTLP